MRSRWKIPDCSLCQKPLPDRGNRGVETTANIICEACAEGLRRQCSRCRESFLPSSTKGLRFAYCRPCAREYSRNYNAGKKGFSDLPAELECRWCLKAFEPKTRRTKCCSRHCQLSFNDFQRRTGLEFRSTILKKCSCGQRFVAVNGLCIACYDPICRVDGCDDKIRKYGFCNKHALRFKRYGDPLGTRPRPTRSARPRCRIENCRNPESVDGCCRAHWERLQRPEKQPKLCSVDGCGKKHHGKGFCSFHYGRHLNGVPFDQPVLEKKYGPLCSFDGCAKPNANMGYGLCRTHFRAKTRRRYKNGISWQRLGPLVDWRCHLCGEKVEQTPGTWESPLGANVDHLIPRSKGGSDSWDNVLLAHYQCNVERSDAALDGPARQRSLEWAKQVAAKVGA